MGTELTSIDDATLVNTLAAAAVLSVVLPRFTYGRYLLYPFALLGTWAHETGHGIAAILVGGKFKSLEIYSNLGGVAFSTGTGNKKKAIVAAGGLIGPAVAGGAVILFSSRQELAPWVLAAVATCLLLTTLLFIRNRFGFTAMLVISLMLFGLTIYSPPVVRVFLAQFIGIQFCVACWNTVDYMFTKHFYSKGRLVNSDTQDMAEALMLPYWFWAMAVSVASVAILASSVYLAWLS